MIMQQIMARQISNQHGPTSPTNHHHLQEEDQEQPIPEGFQLPHGLFQITFQYQKINSKFRSLVRQVQEDRT